MRLLDTETGHFVELTDLSNIHYAILSHTWDLSGEQTYQELREIQRCFPSKRTSVLRESIHPIEEEKDNPPLLPKDPVVPTPPRTCIYRSLALLIGPLLFLVRWLRRVPRTYGSTQAADPVVSAVSIWDHRELSDKIRKACAIARAHGYRYIWIDSCCIDKTSSSELSEAINSMFAWYRSAAVCYAFLADVPDRGEKDSREWEGEFRSSRWFGRGWTLQELIAPRTVVFLSKEWNILGSKSTLLEAVHSATGIQSEILTHSRLLSEVSIATRMSWAATRRTTRVEDKAYSLLGIFDINMPTLYGEGGRAFWRLQEEILRRSPDQSLFAWGDIHYGFILPPPVAAGAWMRSPVRWDSPWPALLAPSVEAFLHSSRTYVRPIPHDVFLSRLGRSDIPIPEFTITPHGIRTQIPLVSIRDLAPKGSVVTRAGELSAWDWYYALLACELEAESDDAGYLVAFLCGAEPSSSPLHLLRFAYGSDNDMLFDGHHIFALSLDEIERCRDRMRLDTVYLSLPDSVPLAITAFAQGVAKPVTGNGIEVSGWSKALLHMQGYEVRSPVTHAALPVTDDDWELRGYYTVEIVKGGDAIAVWCHCDVDWGNHAAVRLAVSCRDVAQATPHPSSSKTFEHKEMIAYERGVYLVDRLRATLKTSAGDTLVIRLGVECMSREWFHLHVEVVGEGAEGSSSGAGRLQDEEMGSGSGSDSTKSGSEALWIR